MFNIIVFPTTTMDPFDDEFIADGKYDIRQIIAHCSSKDLVAFDNDSLDPDNEKVYKKLKRTIDKMCIYCCVHTYIRNNKMCDRCDVLLSNSNLVDFCAINCDKRNPIIRKLLEEGKVHAQAFAEKKEKRDENRKEWLTLTYEELRDEYEPESSDCEEDEKESDSDCEEDEKDAESDVEEVKKKSVVKKKNYEEDDESDYDVEEESKYEKKYIDEETESDDEEVEKKRVSKKKNYKEVEEEDEFEDEYEKFEDFEDVKEDNKYEQKYDAEATESDDEENEKKSVSKKRRFEEDEEDEEEVEEKEEKNGDEKRDRKRRVIVIDD